MVTRLNEPAKARKSLPLTDRDLADLERLRGHSPEREALAELAGVVVESVTEAALLHMIFAAGLRAIREKAEERAYASAAAEELRAARPLPGNEYKVTLARNLIEAVLEELSS